MNGTALPSRLPGLGGRAPPRAEERPEGQGARFPSGRPCAGREPLHAPAPGTHGGRPPPSLCLQQEEPTPSRCTRTWCAPALTAGQSPSGRHPPLAAHTDSPRRSSNRRQPSGRRGSQEEVGAGTGPVPYDPGEEAVVRRVQTQDARLTGPGHRPGRVRGDRGGDRGDLHGAARRSPHDIGAALPADRQAVCEYVSVLLAGDAPARLVAVATKELVEPLNPVLAVETILSGAAIRSGQRPDR